MTDGCDAPMVIRTANVTFKQPVKGRSQDFSIHKYFQFLTSYHRRMYKNILTNSTRGTLDFQTFFKMAFRLSRISLCQAAVFLRQLID